MKGFSCPWNHAYLVIFREIAFFILGTCLSHVSASKFPLWRWAPCNSETFPPSWVQCNGNFQNPRTHFWNLFPSLELNRRHFLGNRTTQLTFTYFKLHTTRERGNYIFHTYNSRLKVSVSRKYGGPLYFIRGLGWHIKYIYYCCFIIIDNICFQPI
jgi:hypothetical protein